MSRSHVLRAFSPAGGAATSPRTAWTRMFQTCFAVTFLMLCAIHPTFAQATDPAPDRTLNIGIYVSPPFVESSPGGGYSGMAIDLWEAIAARSNLPFQYAPYPTFRALVEATRTGEVDAAVTNLTITRGRAEVVSFTQPWFDAGLRIMVPREPEGGFWSVIGGLSNAGHLRAYAWLLFVIAVATIGLTVFDRKFDPEFPRRWREGMAESFHHVVSIATSGRTARKNLFGWAGRIWSAIWMVCGVAVIAYITSSVTSVMTAVSLTHGINSLSDLPGRTVAVFSGSVAEEYVDDLGIAARAYPNIDDAVAALRRGAVDAIVADAPILEHFVYSHTEQKLAVVGNLFHPDKYGFAFPTDSPLQTSITLDILKYREDGTLEALRRKYFGQAQ